MENFFLDSLRMTKMTAAGRNALAVVEKFVAALLQDDLDAQLALLQDEVTVDYAGRYGLGKMKRPKADAADFHRALRRRIVIKGYNIYSAYGDANTVFILGDTTESIKETGFVLTAACIWIFTLEGGLIQKIAYLKESHALYVFFSAIIEGRQKGAV